MTGKRRFHRVKCATEIVLKSDTGAYQGRLENISPDGALVMLQGSAIALVKTGDKCTLAVYPGNGEVPLQFMAEVVHSGFSMAGIKFLAMDADTKNRLRMLMDRVTSEPEKCGKKPGLTGG
ncbi:MAG: type IV pilus assembly protein [Geobacteraceae bacterium]|nr:MAG: type IV pilus assembly protein [Geobacteraceae bacterium]